MRENIGRNKSSSMQPLSLLDIPLATKEVAIRLPKNQNIQGIRQVDHLFDAWPPSLERTARVTTKSKPGAFSWVPGVGQIHMTKGGLTLQPKVSPVISAYCEVVSPVEVEKDLYAVEVRENGWARRIKDRLRGKKNPPRAENVPSATTSDASEVVIAVAI